MFPFSSFFYDRCGGITIKTGSSLMTFASKADEKLFPYFNNEAHTKKFLNYSPEAINRVLIALGSPHREYPVFHIAGTNGKGSTASYIHSLLSRSGIKCGLFTSPHLSVVHERIVIDSMIDDNDFAGLIERVDRCAVGCGVILTWFDMICAAAFLYFKESNAGAAVIECGLGGRLDSTNCVDPEVAVITEISFDHCHLLGNTIEEIAAEKAGIMKPRRPAVISAHDEIARRVFRARAAQLNIPIFFHGEDYSFENCTKHLTPLNLAQPGEFQKINFSTALTAVKKSSLAISDRAIDESAAIHIRGRCEQIHDNPLILFDPAHNPAAIELLLNHISDNYRMPVNAFISIMSDKDCDAIIALLRRSGSRITYILQDDPRQYKPVDLETVDMRESEKIVAALDPSAVNLFTGSFRLYSMVSNLPIGK